MSVFRELLCIQNLSIWEINVKSAVFENEISLSTKKLFHVWFGVGFYLSYAIGKSMWDEAYRYKNYMLYPDNLKKIDAFKTRVYEMYTHLDRKYDLPKDFSLRSFDRLVLSIKRVRKQERESKQKEKMNELIQSSKYLDDLVDKILYFLKGKSES